MILRAPEPSDLDCLYRWCNDSDEWHNTLSDGMVSRHVLWDYLENYDDNIGATGQVRFIVMTEDGTAAGTVDLCDYSQRNATAYVSIYIDHAYRGRGLGRRALDDLIYIARQRYSLRHLAACIAADNAVSLSLFTAAGFREAGRFAGWVMHHGEPRDVVLLQL